MNQNGGIHKGGFAVLCHRNGGSESPGILIWGILKREMYYGKKYHTREELVQAITSYIDYYINDRPQRGLDVLTPFEFHERLLAA